MIDLGIFMHFAAVSVHFQFCNEFEYDNTMKYHKGDKDNILLQHPPNEIKPLCMCKPPPLRRQNKSSPWLQHYWSKADEC